MNPFPDNYLENAFVWVLATSFHATVLMLLVWALQLLFRRWLRPRWRYALSLLVLLRLIMPDVPASGFSVFQLAPRSVREVDREFAPATRSVVELVRAERPQKNSDLGVSAPETRRERANWSTLPGIVWLGGMGFFCMFAFWQQHRFSRRFRDPAEILEPKFAALMIDCARTMGIHRAPPAFAVEELPTPVLAGAFRPRLLLPSAMLPRLDDAEMRMIVLHEFAHLKRYDLLWNWVIVVARALHWFNPLTWLAMRRLLADRELVCDAMVLERLTPGERRTYGETLVRLAAEVSSSKFCPGVAPVIGHVSELKRRVIMITRFKRSTVLVTLGSSALIVVLLGIAFTRARETRYDPTMVTMLPGALRQPLSREEKLRLHLKNAESEVSKQRTLVKQTFEELEALRQELGLSGQMANEGRIPENAARGELERARAEAQSKLIYTETRLSQLKSLDSTELRKVILTFAPDENLSALLQDYARAEQSFAAVQLDHSSEHPETKKLAGQIKVIQRQIDERIEGILLGMQTTASAARAQIERLEAQAEMLRRDERELDSRLQQYRRQLRHSEFEVQMLSAMETRLQQARSQQELFEPGSPRVPPTR